MNLRPMYAISQAEIRIAELGDNTKDEGGSYAEILFRVSVGQDDDVWKCKRRDAKS
jgi:hypothetical protein